MKRLLLSLTLTVTLSPLFAQKVESIHFHLYTDSLKKGQNNYINVDGKMSNGRWMPLTSKDIEFSCPEAAFQGNELIIPENFTEKKVTVTAVFKKDPSLRIEKTIWIKQLPDPLLPTKDEMMGGQTPARKRKG